MKKANKENFQEIIQGEKVLVDIWAEWCNPCKALTPKLEELSSQRADTEFFELNADENGDIAASLGVRAIPTVILFSKGKEVSRFSGNLPTDKIIEFLDK